MPEELDEFGIPIKKKNTQSKVDEFGIPIKKKESTSKDSHFYTKAVKEAGLPVTDQKKEQKPLVSSTTKEKKPDGVYTFEGRKEAVYKKKGNYWYIDPNNSGSFQKIPSNRTDRISILEKQAKRVYNSGVDEQGFEWETEQAKPVDVKIENKDNAWYSKTINNIPTESVDAEKIAIEQQHFDKNFEAKASDDPEVIAKNQKDDYIKGQLSMIDSELVGSSEEEVVPRLNAIIKTLGDDSDSFEVTQTGMGYDAIEIKNKLTGQKMFINLDNWSNGRDVEESKALQAFLDVNTKFSSLNKMVYQREQLRKKAVEANPMDKAEIEKQISDLNAEIRNQEAAKRNYVSGDKYLAAAVYDKAAVNNVKVGYQEAQIKSIDLKKEFDEFGKWKEEVDLAVKDGRISQEEFELNYKPKLESDFNDIQQKALSLSKDFDAMKEEASSMDVVAGLNYAYQENRGNVLTNATSSFMSGAAGVFEFAGDLTVNADKQPGWKMGFDPETSESWTEWISPETISKEYLTSDERSAFEMVIGGLSNSIGSSTAGKLLMPGAPNVGSYFGLFASSYENMRNQFDTPELKDVPEYEKILMSSLYGATVGLLEKYGLSKAMSKSPVSKKYINYILANTLKNIPKGASAEMIEAEINTTIKGMISKGIINIGGASLIEGTTEASQEMADIGLKTVYNEAKGKEFFNTPKTGGELMSRLGENFALGMLGGAGMNSVSQAISIPRQSMTISDLNKIENTITNNNLKDIFKLDIKTKVANGEITKAQGVEKLNNLRNAEATLNLIPKNVSAENKYTAFKLISERENLQSEIKGKDEALVSAQKERINAINEELKTISQNATKENNVEQQEGTTEGSTVEYQGTDEGQQKVGQGEGSQREAAQPEADTSNSTVTSEVQQKEIDILNKFANTETEGVSISIDTIDSYEPYSDLVEITEEDKRKYNGYKVIGAIESDIPGKGLGTMAILKEVIKSDNGLISIDADSQPEVKSIFKKLGGRQEGEFLIIDNNIYERYLDLKKKGIKDKFTSLVDDILDTSNSTVEVTPAFKETEDVNLYSQSLESARAEMKKTGKGDDLQVSPVSPEEAQAIVDEGGKIFISEDGKYGGYVKADGYMGGLFKDPNMKYKGVSKLLQDARVKEGGRFMEGFATYLEKEYVKNGFRPVARLKFNEEYAPEGWDAPNSSLRTKPDVVFFAYDPTGKYEVGEGEYFEDYDQAYETAKNYGIDTKAANAESIEQMLQSEEYADVDTKLLKAARLVSKALPKTKIYLHKTTDAYNAGIARAAGMTKEQVANEEGQSSGEYVNGEIHINLEIADDTTVFHEAFHDIFIKKAFTSGAAIDMANGLRRIISDKQLIEKLDKFISNYESAEQSEEFLAELTGIISAAETELSTTKLHAFKQLINEIAKKLGLPAIFGSTASRQDVLDFINTMSRKLRTGEKIEDGTAVNTRKKRISPENSSNYANLTEDGKGNFVFYHVGGNGFETIKRGSGGTLATSKGEANAIGKVGGIAQYYTRPEDGESMVSGPSKYIVKVDQGKVYDFNTDTDNLFEQAKERFKSEYPGAAFDANTQLAYVTKIANEQGYDMVVADWNGKTRAQTTNEFTPDDVQISEGNTIVQPFKENYISNTANGYESVIPESKISKLEKLFDKIYKVRNAESKYDALYSLGQDYGKMSTEEISSLILNSDLSEEIKNEYNDIMSYVPPVRSSRKKRKAPTVEQQIAKAVRDSKMDFKNKQRAIAAIVKEMRKSGKINTKQAAIIVERFSKLNVDNPITVGKYLDYVGKLMNDADYDQKLKDARSLRSKIKRLKNAQATVVAMGKKFTSIDPSMIDDFESYMEIGDKVYNALKPTRSNGGDPSYRMATVIGKINEYSDKVLSDIEEKVKNDLLETYKGLVDAGIINSEMTLKELQAEIKKMDENPEHVTDFDSDIREINKEMFKSLSETIEMDQFTPEEQKLIKEFMAMDLEKMNVRDGYSAVEAMDNLRLNGILDGIQAMVYKYKGVIGAAQLKDADIKTRDLKLYFSKLLGRNITNLSANLKVLADSIFMGVKAGGEVLSKMGINAFESGIAKATQEYRREVDKYGEMFYKTKPNGESFHTSRNAFERGFYATLKRTVIGSESEQKAEFRRKIGLIKESIETLSKGSKEEKKKSEIYQELYNKLGLEKAESILDVETKIDKINRDAVNHTIDMWSKYYQQLSDVSLSVYNSMLKADLNYTPDKFSRLTRNVMSASEAEALISKNGSFASTIGFTDKSKSGVLMESTKPNLVDGRFIDLDFDMNNFSALKAALIDINTAGPVRQIEGFLKSRDYQSLISSAEDMKLFTKRVNNYVMRAKGKEMIDNDSWKDLNKTLNVVSTFGTSKSLGSIFQPIKQVVPVALNTMVNAKTANLNISESMSADFNQWYKENGISTSNRGAESTSAIETAEKYLDKQPDSKIGKAGEYLSKANEFWIKMFLARPDIFIARASWLTYYKQSLKEQGLDTDIDWMTHEKNEQAADFATHNIDRQQNVSDTAMAGELFASSNSLMKIVKNVAFPFASFSMNQKQRMYSDIRTFIDKNATEEDKALAKRSIMGLTAEMITYQAIGWSIRYFIYKSIAEAITGDKSDDDDEERDWKNALQYTIGSVVKDFFSIAPPLDGATLSGFDYLMKNIQDWSDFGSNDADEAVKAANIKREERDEEPMTKDQEAKFRSNLFDENRWEFKDYDSGMVNLGTYTILKDKISEAYKLEEIVRTGKVVEETQWGIKEKYLLPEDVSKLKAMIALDVAFLTGALPTDVHSVSKKVQTLVKRRALTEVQMEKYKEIKKEYGNVPDYVLGIIKDTRKEVPKIIEEMEWIKREGGLTKVQEKKYMSIMKKNGEVTVGDLRKIKSGS